MRIEIVVFDGFDELDVFGPFEVLAMAGFEVRLVTPERAGSVVSMRGVRLDVPDVLGSGAPDGVVVPGGGWLNRAAEGAWAQAQRGTLPRQLAEVAESTRWMASVCTGAFLLAEAGLLDGRAATTNPGAYQELRAYPIDVRAERVVDDRDRITAGAPAAGLDLGLWITEREGGKPAAERVSRSGGFAAPHQVWHASQGTTVSGAGG